MVYYPSPLHYSIIDSTAVDCSSQYIGVELEVRRLGPDVAGVGGPLTATSRWES